MQSFIDNFEGTNHRYFNRKQYRYLHLLSRKLIHFLVEWRLCVFTLWLCYSRLTLDFRAMFCRRSDFLCDALSSCNKCPVLHKFATVTIQQSLDPTGRLLNFNFFEIIRRITAVIDAMIKASWSHCPQII